MQNDDLLGVGIIRPIYEIIVALDVTKDSKVKLNTLRELMIAGYIRSEKYDIQQLHAFVDSDFARVLEKHFGFKKCKGEAMLLNLR